MSTTTAAAVTKVSDSQLRNGIMPRALLSEAACKVALGKTDNVRIRQFAEWELMEATTVIKVLKDLGTPAAEPGADALEFLASLKAMTTAQFNAAFMKAELSNHEFLRDLAKEYLDGTGDGQPGGNETQHVAMLAHFAFTEHVGLCADILEELN